MFDNFYPYTKHLLLLPSTDGQFYWVACCSIGSVDNLSALMSARQPVCPLVVTQCTFLHILTVLNDL